MMRTYFEDAIPWAFGSRDETEEWRKLPFLGFLAGTVVSVGIWVVLGVTLWGLVHWPV